MHFRRYKDIHFRTVLRKLQNERGDLSEDKVLRACTLLKEEGYILNFAKSVKNSFNDVVKKRDFLIIVPERGKIWFQVKSSERGVKNHLGKNTDVPVIKVEPYYSVEYVKDLIIKAFSLQLVG